MSEVNRLISEKIEQAFWELDDVVVATAPDTPQNIMDAWLALFHLMPRAVIVERDRIRGTNNAAHFPASGDSNV